MNRASAATALLLAGLAFAPVAATAADPYPGIPEGPEAQLSWHLAFGGATTSPQSRYSLTLGYRALEDRAPLPLVTLDVSDQATVARLAGLPVAGRHYGTNQTEGTTIYGVSPVTFVWWVVSGIVATVWIVDVASDDDDAPAAPATGATGA